jgi:predicted Na+-dependent transporter
MGELKRTYTKEDGRRRRRHRISWVLVVLTIVGLAVILYRTAYYYGMGSGLYAALAIALTLCGSIAMQNLMEDAGNK